MTTSGRSVIEEEAKAEAVYFINMYPMEDISIHPTPCAVLIHRQGCKYIVLARYAIPVERIISV